MRVGAILAAGGVSGRMGFDKLFAPLAGRTVLERALAPLEASPWVHAIAVVLRAEQFARAGRLFRAGRFHKIAALVPAGSRRRASIASGLAALPPCELVLVHDAARPLVTAGLLCAVIEAAHEHGAAAPAVPLTDTVKLGDERDLVVATPERARLRRLQTPQVFRRELLERAHREAAPQWTDDAAMLLSLGLPVRLVPGSADNLKLTYPSDLPLAEALLASRRL